MTEDQLAIRMKRDAKNCRVAGVSQSSKFGRTDSDTGEAGFGRVMSDVLRELRKGPRTAREVADACNITTSQVWPNVKALERHFQIRRTDLPGNRKLIELGPNVKDTK